MSQDSDGLAGDPPNNAATDSAQVKWQWKMLPLMRNMLVGLAIFFFAASLFQLFYLQNQIRNSPRVDFQQAAAALASHDSTVSEPQMSAAKLRFILLLESNTMERRHHEANVFLQSSIWVRYMGFVTGMILAIIGAVFILGRLQESQTELSAKVQMAEMSLKSASPGIILSVLGTLLMVITIVMQHEVSVTDDAVYLNIKDQRVPDPKPVSKIRGQSKPSFDIPIATDSSTEK